MPDSIVTPAVQTPDPTPVVPVVDPHKPTDPPAKPLHEDPAIAKALEGLTEEQRATLLTTGGKNALAARLEEAKEAKAKAATAAETARAELAQSIGKALGLVKDDPIDPAKLTEELTAEKTAAQHARVELAVFKAAGAVNGDPAALLDSTSFLKSLDGIDPTDTAAVQAAIQTAITANPRLGVETGPRQPAPNPAQGSSASGAPDLSMQIAEATKAGNHALAITLKRQLAASKH